MNINNKVNKIQKIKKQSMERSHNAIKLRKSVVLKP